MAARVKSVIVGLTGGLGNQLFQYAAARSLSLKLGINLEIEHSRFLGDRSYELANFDFSDSIKSYADKAWLPRFLVSIINRLAKRFLTKHKGLSIYSEPHFHYDPHFQGISEPVFLDGYFQSEKYFMNYAEIIRKDLSAPKSYPAQCLSVIDKMNQQDAVAVHIRRGDYVSIKENSKIYHSQPIAYYQDAIALILIKVKNPRCFIFSDDPDWVKKNVLINIPWELVDINSSKDVYWDLMLMRQCKHFVIANSSLSWWGAWLGSYPRKIVIAPKDWFKSDDKDTGDLIPESWIRL